MHTPLDACRPYTTPPVLPYDVANTFCSHHTLALAYEASHNLPVKSTIQPDVCSLRDEIKL